MGWDILLSNRSGLPMVFNETGLTAWLNEVGWFSTLREWGLANPRNVRFKPTDFATFLTLSYLIWPYAVILLYPVLSRIDRSILDAASTMGATPLRVIWRVVFPLVRLALLGTTLLLFVFLLGAYVAITENMERARSIIGPAHDSRTPVIFFQEIHRRDKIDYGRELDGSEYIHCLEGEPGTPVAAEEMDKQPGDYFIHKRRYSCFFGTELEILLKGLKAETLVLIGGMTDVCVHYTFADAHQNDYYVRVVEDCVGGTSPEAHQASLNAMEYLQTGALRGSDEIVAGLKSHKSAA